MTRLLNFLAGMLAGVGLFYSLIVFGINDITRFCMGLFMCIFGTVVYWVDDKHKPN